MCKKISTSCYESTEIVFECIRCWQYFAIIWKYTSLGPKIFYLHALSEKIMKQKSPVGSCSNRFSSSRNSSWVQTLPFTSIHKKSRWSTCMVFDCFCSVHTWSKLGRISLFHCNNASLLLRCWWFLSTAHVARSVISKAQALLLWNQTPNVDVRWTSETVDISSGFPESSSWTKWELRNPARSDCVWSTQIVPKVKRSGPKEGLALKERQVFEEKTCVQEEICLTRGLFRYKLYISKTLTSEDRATSSLNQESPLN